MTPVQTGRMMEPRSKKQTTTDSVTASATQEMVLLQTGRLNKPRSVQADPDAVMACALEIASALHCLHSNGHVHGNISADWCASGLHHLLH